jgi:hypothetical protein
VPQISAAEYGAQPLRVHTLLADVSLHDVWAVDLSRVREGVTLDAFYRLLSQHRLIGRLPPPARALFGLRFFLGRIGHSAMIGKCRLAYQLQFADIIDIVRPIARCPATNR